MRNSIILLLLLLIGCVTQPIEQTMTRQQAMEPVDKLLSAAIDNLQYTPRHRRQQTLTVLTAINYDYLAATKGDEHHLRLMVMNEAFQFYLPKAIKRSGIFFDTKHIMTPDHFPMFAFTHEKKALLHTGNSTIPMDINVTPPSGLTPTEQWTWIFRLYIDWIDANAPADQ